MREYLRDKRKSPHDFIFPKGSHIFKCINKGVWDLYPVYKKAFISKTLHTDYERIP